MKLNRRNTLIGLGTIVAGGGAALGTGAFSSVEAERSVDITTEGDDNALLEFRVTGSFSGISDGGDSSSIELIFDEINEDAVTRFDDAFEVDPTGDDNEGPWDIDIRDASDDSSIVKEDTSDGDPLMFVVDNPDDTDDVDNAGSVEFDVVIDIENNSDSNVPDDITIVAE